MYLLQKGSVINCRISKIMSKSCMESEMRERPKNPAKQFWRGSLILLPEGLKNPAHAVFKSFNKQMSMQF